jgi:hypothetical protein
MDFKAAIVEVFFLEIPSKRLVFQFSTIVLSTRWLFQKNANRSLCIPTEGYKIVIQRQS